MVGLKCVVLLIGKVCLGCSTFLVGDGVLFSAEQWVGSEGPKTRRRESNPTFNLRRPSCYRDPAVLYFAVPYKSEALLRQKIDRHTKFYFTRNNLLVS